MSRLTCRILRVPGRVRRLLVAEDERVAGVEPLARERDAPTEVADRVVGLGRVDRLEAERGPEAAQKGRVGREGARHTVALEEARHRRGAGRTT